MKYLSLQQVLQEGVSHNPAIQKQVMLRSGDVPNLTNFAQARFAPGQVAAAHAHADMSEVFFVQSGTGTITIEGQPYPLTPGTCIAIAPHETHEICNSGKEELVLTYFGIRC